MTDSKDTGPAYEPGPLYEAAHAAELERADRENPIPGGDEYSRAVNVYGPEDEGGIERREEPPENQNT